MLSGEGRRAKVELEGKEGPLSFKAIICSLEHAIGATLVSTTVKEWGSQKDFLTRLIGTKKGEPTDDRSGRDCIVPKVEGQHHHHQPPRLNSTQLN